MDAEHCEAKKHAYRQTQDGVVVSFVLHPNEVPEGLATAALGTRYMLAVVEIGDDEQPKKPNRYVQQAGILSGDEAFRTFAIQTCPNIWAESDSDPAEFIRQYCEVKSRADLAHDKHGQKEFEKMTARFESWRRGL